MNFSLVEALKKLVDYSVRQGIRRCIKDSQKNRWRGKKKDVIRERSSNGSMILERKLVVAGSRCTAHSSNPDEGRGRKAGE